MPSRSTTGWASSSSSSPRTRSRGGGTGAIATELEAILRHGAAQALDALAAGREPTPSVVSAIARADPEVLDDPNVTGNLVFVLRTASVDVASLLHWILKMLGDHPEWCLRVREDGSGDLARRVVLETLRLHQSEFIQRRVLEPVEIEGHIVPAGWFVRLCVRESHRDPEVFSDPASFDPDRFAGRRLSRYEYSPFGRLEHRCIGETLTLALAGSFVSELAPRLRLVGRAGRTARVQPVPLAAERTVQGPPRAARLALRDPRLERIGERLADRLELDPVEHVLEEAADDQPLGLRRGRGRGTSGRRAARGRPGRASRRECSGRRWRGSRGRGSSPRAPAAERSRLRFSW